MSLNTITSVVFLVLIVFSTVIKAKDGQNARDSNVNAITQLTQETLANSRYAQINWLELHPIVQNEISLLQHHLQNALRRLNPSNVLQPLTPQIVIENQNVLLPIVNLLNAYLKNVVLNHQIKKQLANSQNNQVASTASVKSHLQRLQNVWQALPDSVKKEIERRRKEISDINQKLHMEIINGHASQGNIVATQYLIKTKTDALDEYIIQLLQFLNNQQKSGQQKSNDQDIPRVVQSQVKFAGSGRQGQKRVASQALGGLGGKIRPG